MLKKLRFWHKRASLSLLRFRVSLFRVTLDSFRETSVSPAQPQHIHQHNSQFQFFCNLFFKINWGLPLIYSSYLLFLKRFKRCRCFGWQKAHVPVIESSPSAATVRARTKYSCDDDNPNSGGCS